MSGRLVHPLGVARSPRERVAIAICVGALGTLGFSITAPLLPDLADAFSVSRGSIGLVQAAVSVPGVMLSALIGYSADRLGRRRVVLSSLLLFATFGAAGFWARSYWALIGARFLQGVGTSGILGLSIVLIGDLFEGEARTRVMGYNLTGLTAINMAGPILSGFIGAQGVFRPFLVFLVGFPLALWATRMPTDPRREVPSPLRHVGAAFQMLRREGHLSDFVGILAVTMSATILLHGFGYTTTPLYLDSVFGIGPSGRGLIIAGFQIGTILAAIQIGRLRARAGGERVVGMALALMALGTAVTALAPGWWAVWLGLGVSGLGFGLFIPLAQDRTATLGGLSHRGLMVLTWVTFVRVAQVIGPPLGSWLSEAAGPRVTFAIATVGMGFAFLVWRRLRRVLWAAFAHRTREADAHARCSVQYPGACEGPARGGGGMHG